MKNLILETTENGNVELSQGWDDDMPVVSVWSFPENEHITDLYGIEIDELTGDDVDYWISCNNQ